MKFEWDSQKAQSNLQKHQVSFEEAQTVFNDPLAVIFDDEWHSLGEQRELIIGQAANKRLLIVAFTERAQGVVRIISARPTTSKERKEYEYHRKH